MDRICYFAGAHGDWGGASRVLFTNLRLIDRSRFEPIVLLPSEGPAQALLEKIDIPYRIWGTLQEPGEILNYGRVLINSARWFRKQNIKLVHMNRANDWRPAELMAARLSRIPIVTHFHTVNRDKTPATSMSTAIAAVSAYVAHHSDLCGRPATVIHNTVNIDRFTQAKSIRESLGLADNHVVVTFVGQIRQIKGIQDFIAMAKRVQGDQVRFLIAGQCRDNAAMKDSISRESLQAMICSDSRILYCGYQSKIEELYQSSDIVVVPSTWEEPFGLVIIEAGAAGKAVVATRVGGIPEIIEDEKTGYLVDKSDIDALVSRVQSLVDNPAIRIKIAEAAKQRVLQDFHDRPVRHLEALYDSLL